MRIVKILNRVEFIFLALLMIATTFLLFTNVMLRYFWDSALFWSEETLRYCIVWITFIGIATCIRENKHISLDVLMTILSVKPKQKLSIVVQFITLVGSLIILIISIGFVIDIKVSGQVSATIGGFPMYIIYSCMPLGFFLSSIRSIQNIVKTITEMRRGGAVS